MAYEKTVWVNGQAPALDADHLNKMEQGIADAVSVTPQSLTDDQKTQARDNIGAAPSGYGLGGDAKVLTSDDDVNTIGASGWYGWVNNSVPRNAIGVTSLTIMRVDAYSSGVKVQTLYGATDGVEFIMQPLVARRMIYGSKIGAWEWVNPPMQIGVEYRTTERYLGKPVYTKVIDFGASPNNGAKNVNLGASNVDKICGASFHYYVPSTGENGVMVSHPNYTGFLVSNTVVQIRTNTDKTDTNFYVTVKYTKTTD